MKLNIHPKILYALIYLGTLALVSLSSFLSFEQTKALFFVILGVIGLLIIYKIYKDIFKSPYSFKENILYFIFALAITGFFYYVILQYYFMAVNWDSGYIFR